MLTRDKAQALMADMKSAAAAVQTMDVKHKALKTMAIEGKRGRKDKRMSLLLSARDREMLDALALALDVSISSVIRCAVYHAYVNMDAEDKLCLSE